MPKEKAPQKSLRSARAKKVLGLLAALGLVGGGVLAWRQYGNKQPALNPQKPVSPPPLPQPSPAPKPTPKPVVRFDPVHGARVLSQALNARNFPAGASVLRQMKSVADFKALEREVKRLGYPHDLLVIIGLMLGRTSPLNAEEQEALRSELLRIGLSEDPHRNTWSVPYGLGALARPLVRTTRRSIAWDMADRGIELEAGIEVGRVLEQEQGVSLIETPSGNHLYVESDGLEEVT